jgi:hypothetical protein
MKLLDWIPMEKLDWNYLSGNPNLMYATHLLEKNLDNLLNMNDWYYLSRNINALHMLRKYPDKISTEDLFSNPNLAQIAEIIGLNLEDQIKNNTADMIALSGNTCYIAIKLLELVLQHDPDKINWTHLSSNPNALHILEAHPDKIDWSYLSKNSGDGAIKLLKKISNRIDWFHLSMNTSLDAIRLLETNLEKIDWNLLPSNFNALHLLESHPDKLNHILLSNMGPILLSSNINAIHILKKHPDKIKWEQFAMNPSIFEIDIQQTSIYTQEKAKNIDCYK